MEQPKTKRTWPKILTLLLIGCAGLATLGAEFKNDCTSSMSQAECNKVMTVYLHSNVEDEDYSLYNNWVKQLRPTIKAHNGRLIWDDKDLRMLRVKFSSREKAQTFSTEASKLPFVDGAVYAQDASPQ